MSLGSDIFGYIAGATGLIGFFFSIIQSQRPKTKIRHLNDIIAETEDIFKEAKQDDLLDPRFISEFTFKLNVQRRDRERLRIRALCANTWFAECREMTGGLSKTISITSSRVDDLRASILTTSQQERRRLRESSQSDLNGTNNSPSQEDMGSEVPSSLTILIDSGNPPVLHSTFFKLGYFILKTVADSIKTAISRACRAIFPNSLCLATSAQEVEVISVNENVEQMV